MSQVSRRSFLKVTAAAGGGLMIGCVLPATRGEASSKKPGDDVKFSSISVFVLVGTDGSVTITVPKPDSGQGVRTSLAMIIAEELGVDWKVVKVVQAPGNPEVFGRQGVGGSSSVRGSYSALRMAGATAGYLLRQAAAKQWSVDVEQCSIENGQIIAGDKKAGIGEMAEAASKLTTPDRSLIKLKDPSQFTIIGKPTKRVDNFAVVTGKAGFGLDARVKNLNHAVIARPVAFGGGITKFDDTEAYKVPGVTKIYQANSGIVVVADSTWAAIKGRDALKVEWGASPNPDVDSAEISKRFAAAVVAFPDVPAGSQAIEAVYELPYLSHAPMEPMNCTASVTADGCEIWVPTQVPDSARDTAARTLGIESSKVTANVTLVGGGFGRRLSTDYVGEAVLISKEIGAPVQLLWTREDDIRHDHYRPANYHALKGALGADGTPIAFFHQLLEAGGGRRGGGEWRNGRLAYAVENQVIQGAVASPVPTGAWRSVENTYLNLVHECFFDELCAAGKKDPLQARLAMLQNDRIKATLKAAAEKSDWAKALPKGWGRGVACFSGYGSHITQIAEVETKSDGSFKIHRVVAVLDCGLAVNPLGVEAQIQGATMDGIATLLRSAITIKNGGVEQAGLDQFGWARHSDTPVVEVHLIQGSKDPGGIGEVGFPASGPAVLNAIFAATGKRLRKLPIGTTLA